MSSKTDNKILLPGASGWDIWAGSNEKGFTRTLQSEFTKASELDKASSSRVVMGFPIREVLAVPFHVQTDDEAMFTDLAEMHLEKSNIRPEEGAGVLTDVFVASKEDGDSQLLNVVLSAPASDTMPVTSPTGFDVSARFFNFEPNTVTLWRELGRWGFAITGASKGQLAYFQALSSKGLSSEAVRDVKLALMQLSMQGVNLNLNKAVVWLEGDDLDPSQDEIQTFGMGLGIAVSGEPKPAPTMPAELSKLVPADVRAEQRKKADKMKNNCFICLIALLYLAAVGYFAYNYFTLDSDLADQEKEIRDLKTQHAGIGLFNSDWEQLAPVVDREHWPLVLLEKSAKLIATGEDLRFKVFEATSSQITIRGEAAELKVANGFKEKLKKNLPKYRWSAPSATSNAKTKRWEFIYEGTLEGEVE